MNPNKFLTKEEREELEARLRARLDYDLRNALLILFALHSGARASEVLALDWKDLNLKNGELYIRSLKRGRPRTIVLPKFLLVPLTRQKLASPSRPFDLSPSCEPKTRAKTEYNRLGEVWRTYRRGEKRFHSLRHSFAIDLLRRTNNIHFVSRALGHKNIQSTMVYLDFEYTAQEFRKLARVR